MYNKVLQKVKDCEVCLINSRSQPAEPPPLREEFADNPMQKMSSDLFHFGSDTWLILVDWYSNFSFAKKLGRTGGTDKVIKKLKNIFFQQGFCEQLRTVVPEMLPQGGDPRLSLACLQQIQDIKNLLRKFQDAGKDFQQAHSEWRNSPTVEGPSPAQLFYGGQVRSGVLPTLYKQVDVTQMSQGRRKQEQEGRFKRVTRLEAPLLQTDQEVRLQDKDSKLWNIKAWVRGQRLNERSYILETEFGSLFLRNRRFIKEIRSQTASSQSEEELNHYVDHETSGQRQTPKSADKTGEMSGKPPGHGIE